MAIKNGLPSLGTKVINWHLQGGDYVPVRQNRGCFEAVIEVILKI